MYKFLNISCHTFVLLDGEHGQSIDDLIGGQRCTQCTAKDVLQRGRNLKYAMLLQNLLDKVLCTQYNLYFTLMHTYTYTYVMFLCTQYCTSECIVGLIEKYFFKYCKNYIHYIKTLQM